MPPHISVEPNTDIEITLDGGETSATFTRDFWNDKTAAFLDTTTATGLEIPLLVSWDGGPFKSSGHPVLNERWPRARIAKYLSTPDEGATVIETNIGATGTGPWGAGSDIMVNDLPPQHGVRIEFFVESPGGRGPFNFRLSFSLLDEQNATSLSKFTTLASGGGIVPPDRIPNYASLLDGAEVTADNTDTVTVAKGHLVADGRVVTFLDEPVTFDLEDADAVDLGAGEDYRVTLSKDADGANVVTKGPEAEAVLWPDVPAGNIFVRRLVVASADGVAVTVSPASLTGDPSYAAFHTRAGTGLTVLVAGGESVTDTDLRQRQSNEIPVAVTASSTNRLWMLPTGQPTATTTDAAPEIGAFLFAYAVTGVATVTEIIDARPLVHRALTTLHLEAAFLGVLSVTPLDATFNVLILYEDAELESVEINTDDADPLWTAGAVQVDVFFVGPGEPWGAGTTIYTDSATQDERPTIAFDATHLRAVSRFHQVRRFKAGTRFMIRLVARPTASAPEEERELRTVLHFRRYR